MSTSPSAFDYSTKGMLSSGVTGFAAIMLMAVGCFQILQGIAAIANDELFVAGGDYLFSFDTTAWGWVHLVLGLLGVGIGIAILTRTTVGLHGRHRPGLRQHGRRVRVPSALPLLGAHCSSGSTSWSSGPCAARSPTRTGEVGVGPREPRA